MGKADELLAAVDEAFGFLIEEFDFERTDGRAGQREGFVRFMSDTTRVTVHIDYMPFQVNTAVALFKEGSNRRRVDEFGLAQVVREEDPKAAARLKEAAGSETEAFESQAAALKHYAAHLLHGDRERLRQHKLVQVEETRQSNKEEWGTSTGESPRFNNRPSLKDLFADAKNDGMNTARVYQAFWDYDYPLVEIAAFLDETEEQIQARLDDWDGL